MTLLKMKKYLSVIILAFSSLAYAELPSDIMPPKGWRIDSIDNQPIPQELKEKAKRQYNDMLSKGYSDASEEETGKLERYLLESSKGAVRPMEEVKTKLKIKPASLERTPFAKLKAEGATVGGANIGGLWTAVERIFTTPAGAIVKLEELDYVASEGGGIMTREFINADVNGHPAILFVKQSTGGRALTELSWWTDQKLYTLSTSENVKKKGSLEEFMSLARAIQD